MPKKRFFSPHFSLAHRPIRPIKGDLITQGLLYCLVSLVALIGVPLVQFFT